MKEELLKITKDMTTEECIKYLIDQGYLREDLAPIKCTKCDSTNLENGHYEIGGWNIPEGVVCEYDCICKDCGQINGHWAYGGWTL